MGLGRIIALVLLVLHAAVGAIVVLSMAGERDRRDAEVATVRDQAARERTETGALERQVTVKRAIRDGMRQESAYVVELLARRRLGLHGGAGEVAPPPVTPPADP